MQTNKKLSQKELSLYKKSYKGGGCNGDILHWNLFLSASKLIIATTQSTTTSKVLYPGCYRHITPSLIFPIVHYIDYDNKIQSFYSDQAVLNYVNENKQYNEKAQIKFVSSSYEKLSSSSKQLLFKEEQSYYYDLLISFSAGQVSKYCTKYVKENGFLLVSDAHSDARYAFLMKDEWDIYAVWDNNQWKQDIETLQRCFRIKGTNNNIMITKEQVNESIRIGTISKRSFQLQYEPMFYLFQKKKRRSTRTRV